MKICIKVIKAALDDVVMSLKEVRKRRRRSFGFNRGGGRHSHSEEMQVKRNRLTGKVISVFPV